jgi:phosphate ABC transporter permease protein PstC
MKNKRMLRDFILYAAIAGMIASFLFLDFVKLGFYGQKIFYLSGIKLVVVNLIVNKGIVNLPVLTKALSASMLLAMLFTLSALVIKRNYLFCAVGSFTSAVLAIGSLSSISLLNNTVKNTEGLGHLVYIPKEAFPIILISGIAVTIISLWAWNYEKLFEYIFLFFSTAAVISVFVITLYLIIAGAPAIAKIGFFKFLFGTVWKPTQALPEFGIGAMILTTLYGTFGAILIGVPIGVLTAVFLAEIAPRYVADLVRPAVELLAGIPSVLYGFFGMMVIVPAIRDVFKVPVGDSLLAVIIILFIMILPTVISISENAIRAVHPMYKEASLALGATHIQSIFKVIIPAARSGILAAIILGVGRAIGETMAVIMVAGNVVNLPQLLTTVRPMTAGIVLEMAYSANLHRQALFAIGLILFAFILLVNLSFKYVMKKAGAGYEK